MTNKFNPYLDWLGIPSKNPNYYDLLGVSEQVAPDELRAAALGQLKRLKSVDPGPHGEILKKLEARIRRAYRVLNDPRLRSKYDRDRQGEGKDNYSSSETFKTSDTSEFRSDATPNPGALDSLQPSAKTSNGDDEKYANIPMARPLDWDESEGATEVADSIDSSFSESGQPSSVSDSDDDPLGLPVVAKTGRPNVRRRRSSWIVALACMFFFSVGVGGLIYLVMNYPATRTPSDDNTPDVSSSDIDSDDSTDDSESTTEGKPLSGDATQPPPDVDREPTSNQAVRPLDHSTGAPTQIAENTTGKNTTGKNTIGKEDSGEAAVEMTEDRSEGDSESSGSASLEGDTADDFGILTEYDPEPSGMDGESAENDSTEMEALAEGESDGESDPTLPPAKPLEFWERAEARLLASRIRRCLLDRQYERANELAIELEQLAGVDESRSLDEERRSLVAWARSIPKMVEELNGFWEQVRSSAQIGGDIPVGDTFVHIVESDAQHLLLRMGENVQYEYVNLPNGLAMAIAESGDKENVPDWNLQKAAFYAANAWADPKYKERAEEFLELAAADEYETDHIVIFLDTDFSKWGRLKTPLSRARDRQVQAAMQEMRGQFKVDSMGGRDVPPIDILDEATKVDSFLVHFDGSNPEARAALLEMIGELASYLGDVEWSLAYLDEVSNWSTLDTNRRFPARMLALAKRDLDRENARLWIKRVVEWLDDGATQVKSSQRRKLVDAGIKLAETFSWPGLMRELKRFR